MIWDNWDSWVLWGCAVSGAVLGGYNTWRGFRAERARMNVTLEMDKRFAPEHRPEGTTIIRIVNQSSFALEVIEVGLIEKGEMTALEDWEFLGLNQMPQTVKPRAKIDLHPTGDSKISDPNNKKIRPYIKTACGNTFKGKPRK